MSNTSLDHLHYVPNIPKGYVPPVVNPVEPSSKAVLCKDGKECENKCGTQCARRDVY